LPEEVRYYLRIDDGGEDALLNAMKRARPVTGGLERTQEDLESTLIHALQEPYDRYVQVTQTGLPESNTVEDYLSQSIFAENDTKLTTREKGDPVLRAARKFASQYYDCSVGEGQGKCKSAMQAISKIGSKFNWGMWNGMTSNIVETVMGKKIISVRKKHTTYKLPLLKRMKKSTLDEMDSRLESLVSIIEEERQSSRGIARVFDKCKGVGIKVARAGLRFVEKHKDEEEIQDIQRSKRIDNLCAQTILMKGKEKDDWIEDFPGLEDDIYEIRQFVFGKAYGYTQERTEVMLERRNRPGELRAMEDRARIDFEYMNLNRKVNLWTDFERLKDYGALGECTRARMEFVQSYLKDFDEFIHTNQADFAGSYEKSRKDAMHYVSQHARRLRDFVKSRKKIPVELLSKNIKRIEDALYYYHRGDLEAKNIPAKVISEVEAFADYVQDNSHALFSLENRETVRAAKTAFHANKDGVRRKYYAMMSDRLTDEEKAEYRQDIITTLRESMEDWKDISLMVRGSRTQHFLTRFHSDVQKRIIFSVRDFNWRPTPLRTKIYRALTRQEAPKPPEEYGVAA
jgi:hypothetical protein